MEVALLLSLIFHITLSSGIGVVESNLEAHRLVNEVSMDTMLAIVGGLSVGVPMLEDVSIQSLACMDKSGYPLRRAQIDIGQRIVSRTCIVEIKTSRPVTPVIYNAAGQKVKELESIPADCTPRKILLDATDIPAGLYWLGIPGSKGVVSQRFVVVR